MVALPAQLFLDKIQREWRSSVVYVPVLVCLISVSQFWLVFDGIPIDFIPVSVNIFQFATKSLQNFYNQTSISVFSSLDFLFFCFLNHIFSFWLQFFLSVRVSIRCINSAYNTVISLNLIVWEFCGNAQCPQSFGWVAKFSQNFRTKKLCEISLFYAVKILFDVQVFSTNTLLKFCM